MDSVKERLKAFIEYKKISIRSFENRCGLSYGYVNNMRVSIQPAKLKSISLQFPDLNKSWLLTGEGEMLVPTEGKNVATESIGNYGSVFKSSGIVSIPAKVWDVIEKQADSLKSKDKQIDDLISLLKGLIQK
ncbi:MAG: XRE family transcriptional regulator [Tannerella sp.]|uniref:XRE family transcriptional regulator n=1 Tax=uncultured Coprobacter sp. TaxID=1720550 RepID=UPI00261D9177|nr:XRE family transcriptional regulator [uncultured Coprobacter sp.]MBS6267603.1 XRE family transcriptional regulator [Tannerella sp.]